MFPFRSVESKGPFVFVNGEVVAAYSGVGAATNAAASADHLTFSWKRCGMSKAPCPLCKKALAVT